MSGYAITFVGEEEYKYLRNIERHIGLRINHLEYKDLTVEGGHPKPKKSSKSKGKRYGNRARNRSQRPKARTNKSRAGRKKAA